MLIVDKNNILGEGEKNSFDGGGKNKKYIYLSFFLFCTLLLISITAIFMVIRKRQELERNKISAPIENSNAPATTSDNFKGNLPTDLNNAESESFDFGSTTDDIKAEDLTFGYFYEPVSSNFKAEINDYSLPINVKTDVSNYHQVARKINLDPYVNNLNKNGFSVIDNNFQKEANDFYSASRLLAQKEIPIVITSDFITYFYQNNLKEIYKEIEKTTFFENIWDVSNNLYQISLVRYKNRRDQVGLANDPLLEASRLECAYFATALRLMSPGKGQVNQAGVKNDALFDEGEAQKYYFELPDFLKDDVDREVALIKGASKKDKSPILLYERNYKNFLVPKEYNQSAKLGNYYLALKWLNSIFPLYYKNDQCPGCLLDYDDWKINIITAGLISKDLYENQELKNKWAIVYKFIAFFEGLRQDLTYLNYAQVFNEKFGDQNVNNMFSSKRSNADYADLQKMLSIFSFNDMEGMVERNSSNKPVIGLRLLQEPYWPNDYILNRLTGTDMVYQGRVNEASGITRCLNYRCSGFSYDIANLISTDKLSLEEKSYSDNINYLKYEDNLDKLKRQIGKFNINSWNSNIFWITLDIGRKILEFDKAQLPVFVKSKNWQNEKSVNSFLGSWVNINLPGEKAYDYFESAGKTNEFPDCNNLSYIEPNIDLLQEIIAKNKMLIKMLNALNITKKNNIASVELVNLNSKFEEILAISKKELSGQEINDEECNFINDFAIRYAVNSNSRSFVISGKEKRISESISGIKFLGLVYKKGDKLIFSMGPVFNFKESLSK